jgi:hypothetical protein
VGSHCDVYHIGHSSLMGSNSNNLDDDSGGYRPVALMSSLIDNSERQRQHGKIKSEVSH